MAQIISSNALWSDVDVPTSYLDRPFHQWLIEHGLDPQTALVRGALHGEALVGIEAWSPDPGVPLPTPSSGDSLDWPGGGEHGTHVTLHEVEALDALEDLGEVLSDSMLVPYTVDPIAFEIAPQAWRVLAHRAHWENEKMNHSMNGAPDDEASFQLGRVSNAMRHHPLDQDGFTRVRETYLVSRYRSSMSLDQYHAWFGRSWKTLNQDGTLNAATMKTLHERLAGLWLHQPVDEQQAMARRLIKPHPLHEHLMVQAIERWHLEQSLAGLPDASPTAERPRARL